MKPSLSYFHGRVIVSYERGQYLVGICILLPYFLGTFVCIEYTDVDYIGVHAIND